MHCMYTYKLSLFGVLGLFDALSLFGVLGIRLFGALGLSGWLGKGLLRVLGALDLLEVRWVCCYILLISLCVLYFAV